MPSDDMRSRTSQATLASMVYAPSSLARSLGPKIRLNLEKVFSARACW
jgi:hypothetical protein